VLLKLPTAPKIDSPSVFGETAFCGNYAKDMSFLPANYLLGNLVGSRVPWHGSCKHASFIQALPKNEPCCFPFLKGLNCIVDFEVSLLTSMVTVGHFPHYLHYFSVWASSTLSEWVGHKKRLEIGKPENKGQQTQTLYRWVPELTRAGPAPKQLLWTSYLPSLPEIV